MGEVIFGIFLFIALTFIAVIVFGGWVIIGMVRMTLRWIGGDAKPSQLTLRPEPTMSCPNDGCHADNPVGARYCRRCGRSMVREHVAAKRRVAVTGQYT